MLTIKRVPTVLSNYQEEAVPQEAVGCGRNCLGSCCLPVSKLPLFACNGERKNLPKAARFPKEDPPLDFLNTLVLGQWEDRMNRGLFRYDVTACPTKVIPGEYGFVAQLNEGRHLKKRPTEFRVDRVLQEFDPKKFNFTKVGQEEIIFRFEESSDGKSHYYDKAPVNPGCPPSVVAINVSPIEYGHVLLIPRVSECLPQRIDPQSFLLALEMAVEADSPYFRLGYNSLGAFATINHLHFQAYYLAVPFPVERAPTKRIPLAEETVRSGVKIPLAEETVRSGVKISYLMGFPVRGLVFEGGNTLKDLSDTVSSACICLQEHNVPFNVLISDSGRKIFLFPQCYAEKQALGEVSQELLDTQVNPAVWEISGHMVLKRRKDYEEASEEYAWRLLAEVSLSEARFQEVKAYIFEATGLVEVEVEEEDMGSSGSTSETNPEAVFQPAQLAATHSRRLCGPAVR